MSEVVMYYRDNCVFSRNAEKLLLSKGIDINKINVELEPEKFVVISEELGLEKVPQVFINDKHVGGFEDLYELDMDDELEPLLGL